MTPLVVNAVGTLAALCSMTSFAPQLIKIWKEKDASQVSLWMYLVTVVGFGLWIAYGVMLKSWPLVGSNSVCLLMSASILALRVRYGGEAPSAEGDSSRRGQRR